MHKQSTARKPDGKIALLRHQRGLERSHRLWPMLEWQEYKYLQTANTDDYHAIETGCWRSKKPYRAIYAWSYWIASVCRFNPLSTLASTGVSLIHETLQCKFKKCLHLLENLRDKWFSRRSVENCKWLFQMVWIQSKHSNWETNVSNCYPQLA